MKRVKINIKKLRKKYDLTQTELGAKLGVSSQAVLEWEKVGSVPDVRMDRLIKFFGEEL